MRYENATIVEDAAVRRTTRARRRRRNYRKGKRRSNMTWKRRRRRTRCGNGTRKKRRDRRLVTTMGIQIFKALNKFSNIDHSKSFLSRPTREPKTTAKQFKSPLHPKLTLYFRPFVLFSLQERGLADPFVVVLFVFATEQLPIL